MKFLESKEVEVKKGKMVVTYKPVTPLNQAALLGYQAELYKAIEADDVGRNVQVQMKTTAYALNEMISSLIVDGESFDPKMVAVCANASDPDTFNILKDIYAITSDLLLEGYTKKKSSSPASHTKKDTAAQDAPKATKG